MITNKKFIYGLLFLLISLLSIINPLFLSASGNTKYASFAYIITTLLLSLFTKPRFWNFKRLRVFWALIAVNLCIALIYIGDGPTVINLITLIVSYLSIFYLAVKGIKACGEDVFTDKIFLYIGLLLIISLIISPILTLLHWPENAPLYFPWEAFYSDKRFLLIIGQHVGHSNAMWLMAFTAAYIMSDFFTNRHHWRGATRNIVIVLLFLLLIATKSRLALIFVILLMIAWLSYHKIVTKRLYAIAVLAIPLLYFGSITIPSVNLTVFSVANNMQKSFPNLRIFTSSHLSGESSLYAGRYALNYALINTFIEHPLVGVGHSYPLLNLGVDKDGEIAYKERNRVSGSESGLRMMTKYGGFYYLFLILFMLLPIIRAFHRYYPDNLFVLSTCGIILVSSIGGSTFENLYGMSGLFALILINFHIEKPMQKIKRTPKRHMLYKQVDFHIKRKTNSSFVSTPP